MRGEPAREVIGEYPLEALREAITNAVCHRDYLDNGQTQVRWYDDNVIFLNPGGLAPAAPKAPAPLRVEELKHGHRSVPRNRKVAEMFFYAGLPALPQARDRAMGQRHVDHPSRMQSRGLARAGI